MHYYISTKEILKEEIPAVGYMKYITKEINFQIVCSECQVVLLRNLEQVI